MENEQLTMYDVPPEPPKQDNKQKKSWEDGFQRWSNEQFDKNPHDQPLGCCGWGSMCNYCEDNSYGRPCVRALNKMCRTERITIDYSKRNYEDIWNGVFEDDK